MVSVYENQTQPGPRHDQIRSPEDEGEGEERTITICISLSVVAVIFCVCAIMCYREVSRRRKEMLIFEEHLRREVIKRSIQMKLKQLQQAEDSGSYRAKMEEKVPVVTFSDVVQINPALTPAHSEEDLLEKPAHIPARRNYSPPAPRAHHYRQQRVVHPYQSYYNNIVKLQPPARAKPNSRRAQNGSPHKPMLPQGSPSINNHQHTKQTSNGSSRQYLRDDISQHPLGMPLKEPSTRSLYTYFRRVFSRQECPSSVPELTKTTTIELH
ncbi:uncharacterized protein LOC131946942 [Physella acuta]|uniref:uncharacterized protein LOC131946942 n=1 Tax=Physella acuta TaxID=109671 RepID=UPI0027DB3169|nr:uncharacterized protein LOC131946942 [Physella acuta]XP_059163980.1 uncharacterized protein LOC131946942 [Physella acuta]XP_059163981.1 uncharacterized protein LOC131946942 [Physella acuta]XP_059163982.1 uncharacterized protein LOC131946942 [Physella acuta]